MHLQKKLLVALVGIVSLIGCADHDLSNRERGAIAGGTVGAGVGAIVGSQSGDAGVGLAIGGATGALVGGVIGDSLDSDDLRAQQQQIILKKQQAELDRQRKELEDLKRQDRYNDSLRRYER